MIKKYKKLIKLITVILLVFFGLFLRIFKITEVPNGFFCDEAARGIQANSIINSGKDIDGNFLPMFTTDFDTSIPAIFTYLTIPSIKVFGLNEFSLRLTSTILDIGSAILIYLIVKKITHEKAAIISLLIYLTQPWAIHYSRIGWEINSYPFFYALGWYIYLKKPKDFKYLVTSFSVWTIAVYTYNAAIIAVIPTLILIILNNKKILNFKKIIVLSGLVSFLIIPFEKKILFDNGLTRWTSLTSNNSWTIPDFIDRVPLYFHHFSASFLLFGDEKTSITRHFLYGTNLINYIIWPFFIYGVFILVRSRSILIIWLIVYPLASTIIGTGPLSSRAIIGIQIITITAVIGLNKFYSLIKRSRIKNFITFYLIICYSLFTIYSYYIYIYIYPHYSSDYWGWQYGPKQILSYYQKINHKYDELYLKKEFNEPQIFIKFYTSSCHNCLVGNFNNKYSPLKKQLFSITEIEKNHAINIGFQFRTHEKIFYPNGQLAFEIVEVDLPQCKVNLK